MKICETEEGRRSGSGLLDFKGKGTPITPVVSTPGSNSFAEMIAEVSNSLAKVLAWKPVADRGSNSLAETFKALSGKAIRIPIIPAITAATSNLFAKPLLGKAIGFPKILPVAGGGFDVLSKVFSPAATQVAELGRVGKPEFIVRHPIPESEPMIVVRVSFQIPVREEDADFSR